MTDDRQHTERTNEREERPSAGPIGTVLGATLGPFGAAVGGVVDERRLAVRFSLGTGGRSAADAGMAEGTPIEIEDTDADRTEEADAGADMEEEEEAGADEPADAEADDDD